MTPEPSEIVASLITAQPIAERAAYLRELLAHVAAGLVIVEGSSDAAEDVYRVGDTIVGRSR